MINRSSGLVAVQLKNKSVLSLESVEEAYCCDSALQQMVGLVALPFFK